VDYPLCPADGGDRIYALEACGAHEGPHAVKARHPDCKIVLIVDENAEKEVAKRVKQAKKDGLIDKFIYGSISASYLADIVDSL